MIFAVPVIAKVLAGLAAPEVGAAPAAQSSDPQKTSGAADLADFTQTVANLDQTAAAVAAQHGAHAGTS
jgi:hypothetical protein